MEVENVTPYHNGAERKSEQVEEMFDSIAPAYDFMNGMMTFGLCRWWRNLALRHAGKRLEGRRPERILDVATGTGDVAFRLAHLYPDAEVRGIDLSEGMLTLARRKKDQLPQAKSSRLWFEKGDSLDLPFADNSFDLLTVAYGVRNYEHLDRGLREMWRVLKPGGAICIVELSEPRTQPVKSMYRLYSRHIIPALGRMISGDSYAYKYLPESIAACPQRHDMTRLMTDAGFSDAKWKSLTSGVVTIYTALRT